VRPRLVWRIIISYIIHVNRHIHTDVVGYGQEPPSAIRAATLVEVAKKAV